MELEFAHHVFISYRRDDAAGHAGRLADHLLDQFGVGSVFMDVESIEAGVDFAAAIERAIAESDAVLVVIGPRWLEAASLGGTRRLDDPSDLVRREVEAALAADVRVIPVLVAGASMAAEGSLPQSIAGLSRRNAVELLDRRWREDVDVLVDVLEGRERGSLGNLPVQPTPFLGRERELAEIIELMHRPEVRLLTLTGPGGIGKTRLSVQAATTLARTYPGGAWFVGLAALRDPGLIAPTIAAALGLREGQGATSEETLQRHLRGLRILLVLDNLEQLLPGAASMLGELVAVFPGIELLISSREPLLVRAERVYQVGELETEDAVALFNQRARAAAAGFETGEDPSPVEAICRRLEGLPLAIELTAARVTLMSPTELLDRLEDRLPMLVGGARDAPERQRTMRATIAWSYDLLDEDERRTFADLAVFRGGCSLEAADEVCDADLATIGSLVDKNLLRTEERPAGSTRYRSLETIREFALQKLEERPQSTELRARHAAWCLALAEEALPGLKGRDLDTWVTRLEVEHDNIRSALRWSLDAGDAGTALAMASALWLFWDMHGDVTEGRAWLAEALAGADPEPSEVRALALTGAGWLAAEQGDPTAVPLLEDALGCSRHASPSTRSMIKSQLMTYLRDDQARARTLGDEAIAEARDSGDGWVLALALNNRAEHFREDGDLERAQNLYEESLRVSQEIGDSFQEALCLNNLGEVAHIRGELGRADALFLEALHLAQRGDDKRNQYAALLNIGWVSLSTGDITQAERRFRESLAILRDLGHLPVVTSALRGIAAIAGTRGDDERAGRLAGAADAIEDRVGPLPTPPDAGAHLPHLRTARDRAGDRWESYRDAGRRMKLDAILDYALD